MRCSPQPTPWHSQRLLYKDREDFSFKLQFTLYLLFKEATVRQLSCQGLIKKKRQFIHSSLCSFPRVDVGFFLPTGATGNPQNKYRRLSRERATGTHFLLLLLFSLFLLNETVQIGEKEELTHDAVWYCLY